MKSTHQIRNHRSYHAPNSSPNWTHREGDISGKFITKPWSEPVLLIFQMNHYEKISVQVETKSFFFHSMTCVWKWCSFHLGHKGLSHSTSTYLTTVGNTSAEWTIAIPHEAVTPPLPTRATANRNLGSSSSVPHRSHTMMVKKHADTRHR